MRRIIQRMPGEEKSFPMASYTAGLVRSEKKTHRLFRTIFLLCYDEICFEKQRIEGKILAFEREHVIACLVLFG